jgi:DNA repair protein RecN (Recombination protein N)
LLTELYVEHFVLIESLRLHFGRGLHVFTGETGAGKSLLLDATRLALGGRSSLSSIQRGADHALVEAVFQVDESSPARSQLDEWAIDCQDGVIVLTRVLYANGRSVCRINGRTVTVQMLKSVGNTLVEMQGQHESQTMLTGRYQRTLIDLYGQHQPLLAETATLYREWRSQLERLNQAQMSEQERARQLDMLKFQVEEIENAAVTPGEEEDLRAQRQRLMAYDRLKQHLDIVLSSLEDGSFGALSQLTVAEREVDEIVNQNAELADVGKMIQNARVNVEEAAFTLNKFAAHIEADPNRLEYIDNRLVLLKSLTRKYGPTTADVVQHLEQSKQMFSQLMEHEQTVDSIRKEVEACQSRYLKLAKKLHDARVSNAQKLQREVQRCLHQLHMRDARFEVSVQSTDAQWSEEGFDHVDFLFSGNPGEPLMSLEKVASGGELSRTLLALKVVVANLEQVETLIFDEIDAGVSGEAAQRVAEMLRQLGADRQVLCVTHAAQVAAAGHEHFQITKDTKKGRAQTRIHLLEQAARREELGRLLGASVSDETAMKHADALLESFRKETITNV